MPISTNSPLREILWNKLYAPQYQTVDQNNITVAADRNRRVGTTDAIMQGDQFNTEGMIESNKQKQLALEQAIKADPNNQQLAAQLSQLRAEQPILEQKLQTNIANQGMSYEDQMRTGSAARSAFNVGEDAGKIMLGLPNLTKQEDLSYIEDRRDRETFDNLAAKVRKSPTVDAGQPDGKVPDAPTNTTTASDKNANTKKQKGGKK